jgi:hypothetical protein
MTLWQRGLAASIIAIAGLSGPVWAAPPLVEIFAYAHPPVESALKPVREILARQGAAVRVVEIDLDRPEAERRLQALGVNGHVASLILVDGQRSFTRGDGKAVEFVNFPAGSDGPAAMRGSWTMADLQAVLAQRAAK